MRLAVAFRPRYSHTADRAASAALELITAGAADPVTHAYRGLQATVRRTETTQRKAPIESNYR